MFLSLGLPSWAAASHGHEFSHEPAMDQEHPFTHPFQYLHARLQAFTTTNTPLPSSAQAVDVDPLPQERPCSVSSEDHDPVPDNDSSAQGSVCGESKRAARRTTKSFQLAQPPPVARNKFKLRRVVLQLRQISDSRSPTPAMDVLPITPMSLTSSLSKQLPRRLTPRSEPCATNMVVFKCQPYNTAHRANDSSDDDSWDHRELVAAIYQIEKNETENQKKVEICFSEGSTWIGTSMACGGYEFLSTDEHGIQTKARWVPKQTKSRRQKDAGAQINDVEDRKFKFSLLNQNARRHPVIGHIDRHTIEVLDQFVVPSDFTPVSGSLQPLPLPSLEPAAQKHVINTEDRLRQLILITGTWVAYAEGWVDAFKHCGNDANNDGRLPAQSSPPKTMSRHAAFGILHRGSSSSSTLPRLSTAPQRQRSLGGSLRSVRSSAMLNNSTETSPTAKVTSATRERRTKSVSNVYGRGKFFEPPLQTQPEASRDDEEDEEVNEHIGDIPRLQYVGLLQPEHDLYSAKHDLGSLDSASISTRTTSTSTMKRPGRVNKMLNFLNRKATKEK